MRFIGGQIRLGLSQRMGVEVSLDSHSEDFELLNQKVKERPIQVSLLLKLAGGSVQPYLLGGPGGTSAASSRSKAQAKTSRPARLNSAGMRAGGLEVLLGRHVGIHGDYRYTFLDFGNDDDDGGFIGNLVPGSARPPGVDVDPRRYGVFLASSSCSQLLAPSSKLLA